MEHYYEELNHVLHVPIFYNGKQMYLEAKILSDRECPEISAQRVQISDL